MIFRVSDDKHYTLYILAKDNVQLMLYLLSNPFFHDFVSVIFVDEDIEELCDLDISSKEISFINGIPCEVR